MKPDYDSNVKFPCKTPWSRQDEWRIRTAYPRLKALRLTARELKGLLVREPQGMYAEPCLLDIHEISRKHLIKTFFIAMEERNMPFFRCGDLFWDRELRRLITLVGVQRSGVHFEFIDNPHKWWMTYEDFTPPRFILVEMANRYATRTEELAEYARMSLVNKPNVTHRNKRKGMGIAPITQGARSAKQAVNTRNNPNGRKRRTRISSPLGGTSGVPSKKP